MLACFEIDAIDARRDGEGLEAEKDFAAVRLPGDAGQRAKGRQLYVFDELAPAIEEAELVRGIVHVFRDQVLANRHDAFELVLSFRENLFPLRSIRPSVR